MKPIVHGILIPLDTKPQITFISDMKIGSKDFALRPTPDIAGSPCLNMP